MLYAQTEAKLLVSANQAQKNHSYYCPRLP